MKEILMLMHTNQGLKSRQSTRPTVVTWSWPRPPSPDHLPLTQYNCHFLHYDRRCVAVAVAVINLEY